MDSNLQSQPNLVSPPSLDQISPSKNNLKFIIIVVVLVMIVGGAAYYLGAKHRMPVVQEKIMPTSTPVPVSPTSDPTVDWKTHVSNNYGYALKYPADWNDSSTVMGEGFSKNFVKGSGTFSCVFFVNVRDSGSFDSYIAQNRAMKKENSVNVKTSVIKNENNTIIIKEELPDSIKDQGDYATYYIKNEKGKFSYELSTSIEKEIINKDGYRVSYGTVPDQNCLNIFDEMIATFRVTNL